MGRDLMDGIVWVAVGVALMGQAAVIAGLGWLAGEPAASPGGGPVIGLTMLRALVAAAFVCVGVGALYLGYRRLKSDEPAA